LLRENIPMLPVATRPTPAQVEEALRLAPTTRDLRPWDVLAAELNYLFGHEILANPDTYVMTELEYRVLLLGYKDFVLRQVPAVVHLVDAALMRYHVASRGNLHLLNGDRESRQRRYVSPWGLEHNTSNTVPGVYIHGYYRFLRLTG
jgi:hypothetical protein